MRAVWYDRQGPARDVLQLGELSDPDPAAGEVRVRVALSGVSPGDTKKRRGWRGSSMSFPRVIPHSDAAGVIDGVGVGVDTSRVGERVWVWGAQSYRAFGTAAELVTVPADRAVALPDSVTDEVGASLGIPGITAHRAVFVEGAVSGKIVLVQGALGSVSSLAAQLALRAGATVISTVRTTDQLAELPERLRRSAVALDESDPVSAIHRIAPHGVDHVVEVDFSDNVPLDATVLRQGGTIAAYASHQDPAAFPFWAMLFDNISIRLLGSDDFPDEIKNTAAAELTAAAADGDLTIPIRHPFPLDRTADAHDQVDRDNSSRVLVAVQEPSD